ncbi:MAG TPA: sugar ABC transporter permease [Actinomycetota bacterium]|nr:sugar ABC transporter permease [Actinomycetota bacterium]
MSAPQSSSLSLARRVRGSDHLAGWAFTAPAIALIGLFSIFPIIWSVVLSFQHNDLLTPNARWVGWANYKQLASDPVFVKAITHTLIYTSLFVPLSIAIGVLVAVAMNRQVRFMSFYRMAVFITLAISTISTAIMFLWLTDPTYGIINSALHAVGIPLQGFLEDPNEALLVIVAMTVWGWLGFVVIIYLAALQGIPGELLEAASIDSASQWSIFRRITWPLLSPATLFLVVWLTINALQLFDEVYLTTRGGPLYSTTVIVYYLFDQAFNFFRAGLAAAAAYVLFLAILVVTVIQFWLGKRLVHYSS